LSEDGCYARCPYFARAQVAGAVALESGKKAIQG